MKVWALVAYVLAAALAAAGTSANLVGGGIRRRPAGILDALDSKLSVLERRDAQMGISRQNTALERIWTRSLGRRRRLEPLLEEDSSSQNDDEDSDVVLVTAEDIVFDEETVDEEPVDPTALTVSLMPAIAVLNTQAGVSRVRGHQALQWDFVIPVSVLQPSVYLVPLLQMIIERQIQLEEPQRQRLQRRLALLLQLGRPGCLLKAEVRALRGAEMRSNETEADSISQTLDNGFGQLRGSVRAAATQLLPHFRVTAVEIVPTATAAARRWLRSRLAAPPLRTAASLSHGDPRAVARDEQLRLASGRNVHVRTATITPMGGPGISFITDVDDTIKITHVLARERMFRAVLLEPLKAVPGMSALYKTWKATLRLPETLRAGPLLAQLGAPTFHYVSNSPTQLLGDLEKFRRDGDFPLGSWHLRPMALGNSWNPWRYLRSVLRVVFDASSPSHKLEQIRMLMTQLPERRFVMIGDSTELDPEVYGAFARDPELKERVRCVFIRVVSGDNAVSEQQKNTVARFMAAFDGVPRERWGLFSDPDILRTVRLDDPDDSCAVADSSVVLY